MSSKEVKQTPETSNSSDSSYLDCCLGPWYRFGRHFEHAVADGFETLGRSVGLNPRKYCLAVVVFTILCALGFQNFRQESEGDKLWVPSDTRAQQEKAYVDNVWGDGFRGGTVLFDARGGNVLNMRDFEEVWKVQDAIVNDVNGDGDRWQKLCGPRYGDDQCFINGPLQFFLNNRTYYDTTVNSDKDLRQALSAENFPDGTRANRDLIFARYKTDSDDELTSAEGTAVYFRIDDSPLDRALDWETNFLDEMNDQADDAGSGLDVYYIANRSLSDVFGAAIQGDVVLTSVTYLLMILITCVVFAKGCSIQQLRIALALSGIGIVILAMVAGYGLCSGFSVPFVPLHQVLPFVVVGIGVDDMFIIVATFDAQDVKLPPHERLAIAMRRCGLSITYTTATDVMAFLLGATSTLPAIYAFCYYAALSVLFNFCFQITMFSGLLVLDAKRMDSGYPDIVGCCFCSCLCAPKIHQQRVADADTDAVATGGGDRKSIDKQPAQGEAVVAVSADESSEMGGDSEQPQQQYAAVDQGDAEVVTTTESAAVDPVSTIQLQPQENEEETMSEKPPLSFMQRLFRDYYFPFIIRPEVRCLVVAGFAALFAMGVLGSTRMRRGFDQTDFAPDDSYVRQYFDAVDDLGLSPTDNNLPVNIYYKEIDYYKQNTQEEILRLQREFLRGKFNTGPFSSWLEDFVDWVPDSSFSSDVNSDGFLVDKTQFYAAVQEFVSSEEFSRYEDDVIFTHKRKGDPDSLVIRASRTSAFHKNVDTVPNQLQAMQDAREVVDDSSINSPQPIAYSPVYINYETFLVIVNEFVFNMIYALAAVLLISTFILIRPSAVLLVGLLVAVIDVDLVGLMHFWDLEINSITVVQLVMAVGLVVDYVSHIMHYYLQQNPDRSPEERLQDALVEIGPSVLLGCSTTFIGVLPLAFSSTLIFRTFFKMFLLIITLGGGHGLVLLPAILPLIPFGDVRKYTASLDRDGKSKQLSEGSIVPAMEDAADADATGVEMQQQKTIASGTVVTTSPAAADDDLEEAKSQREPVAVAAAEDEGEVGIE